MRLYEGLIIFVPEASVEARKRQVELFEGLVAKHGGVIRNKTDWGKKTVGYMLRKNRDGYILIYEFEVPPAAIVEIERTLTLDQDVLKSMITVKVIKVPKVKKKKASKSTAAVKPVVAAAS